MKYKGIILSLLLLAVAFGTTFLAPYRVYAVVSDLTVKYSVATGSADLIVGAGKSIKTEHGPLNFSAKSGLDTYGTGMVLMPSGNVGIGTTGPASKFHLMWSDAGPAIGQRFSDAAIFENNGNSYIQIMGSEAGEKSINFASPSNGADGAIKYNQGTVTDGFQFVVSNNSVTALALASSGNVGIGTTAPAGLLHISSDTVNLGKTYLTQANASADSFDMNFRKARGTGASPTVITTADELGVLNFTGYGGAAGYITGAAIKAISSGTIADSRVPGQLSFWTGTNAAPSVLTERMTILNNGNVGIGTTSPGNLLHTYWNDSTTADSVATGIRLEQAGDGDIAIQFLKTGTRRWGLGVDSSDANKFKLGINPDPFDANNLLTVDVNGNVGIGTTGPLATLDVAGSASMSGTLTVGNGGTIRPQYGPLTLAYKSALNSWTTGITLQDTTGNVGIGTTTPARLLEVSSATSGLGRIRLTQTSTTAANYSGFEFYGRGGVATTFAGGLFREQSTGDVSLFTGDSGSVPKITILDAGNVGIGTTSPGYKLHVVGDGYFTTDLSVGGTTPTYITLDGNDMYVAGQFEAAGTSGQHLYKVGLGTASIPTNAGDLSMSGNLTVSGAGTNTIAGDSNFDSNTLFVDASANSVGIGTTAPTEELSFTGESNQVIWMERELTAATAGRALSIQAGGAVSGGSDLNGGNLFLNGGISTGGGGSDVRLNVYGQYLAGGGISSGGTSDNSVMTALTVNSDTELILYSSTASIFGLLNVVDEANACDMGSGGTVEGLCIDINNNAESEFKLMASGNMTLQGTSNASGNPDYAELIPVENPGQTEAGDILVVKDGQYTLSDRSQGYNNVLAAKSGVPYQSGLIGVVSDNPGYLIDPNGAMGHEGGTVYENYKPLSVAGRVFVKVSSVNGPIRPGDAITSSEIPGVGMKAAKAGQVVAKALQAYENPDPAGVGKILALVNVSWYDPDVYLTDTGDLEIYGSNGNYSLKNTVANTLVTRIGAFAEAVVANVRAGLIETKKLVVDGVDIAKKLTELSRKVESQQKQIEELKITVEELKNR